MKTRILFLLVILLSIIHLNGNSKSPLTKELPTFSNSNDFSLEVFERFHWMNLKYPQSLKADIKNIFYLVYLNEEDANFDMTLEYCTEIKQEFPKLRIIYIYNAVHKNSRSIKHFESMVVTKGITDPIVLVNDQEFMDNMEILEYPISFIYSNVHGTLRYYEGNTPLSTIKDNLEVIFDQIEIPEDEKLNTDNLVKEMKSIPLVSNMTHIETAANKGWLFVSLSTENRIIVINESGDLIDIIGSGKAGDVDGYAMAARLNHPQGMCWDRSTGILYFADTRNHSIRSVNYQNIDKPIVKTIIDPISILEIFDDYKIYPTNVEIIDTKLLISMSGINEIWTYDLETEILSRTDIAIGHEESDSTVVYFNRPNSITHSKKSGTYIFDSNESGAYKWNIDGSIQALNFEIPESKFGQAILTNKELLVTIPLTNQIAVFKDGEIIEFIGSGNEGFSDGSSKSAKFSNPTGISYMSGTYYVIDQGNNVIRKIRAKSKEVSTLELSGVNLMIDAKRTGQHEFAFTSHEIPTSEGETFIEIVLDFGDEYVIVNNPRNKMINMEAGLVSGTDYISNDEDLNDGKVLISLNGGEMAAYSRMRLKVVYRNKKKPQQIYYKDITLTLLYGYDPDVGNRHELVIPIR